MRSLTLFHQLSSKQHEQHVALAGVAAVVADGSALPNVSMLDNGTEFLGVPVNTDDRVSLEVSLAKLRPQASDNERSSA